MKKRRSVKVQFQESGGGWSNPLMGNVFDSERDVSEEELSKLGKLVDKCDFDESGELPGKAPTDVSEFQLVIERDDKRIELSGDMLRASENLQALVSFIRKHSRKEMLK